MFDPLKEITMKTRMRPAIALVLAVACTPLQRSETRQAADVACVDAAFAAYVARPDAFVADVGRFCMARADHNTNRELALRGSGGIPGRTDNGFDWLPMHQAGASHAGTAGLPQVP